MNRKRLVEWCPFHKDQFLVASNDLRLYQLNSHDDTKIKGKVPPVKVVSICAEVQNIRCVAWNPLLSNSNSPNNNDTSFSSTVELAAGLGNGKMVLLSISNGISQIIKEFTVPNLQRPCTCISWNPINTNFVAVGIDKGKDSLIVWDINKSANILPNPSNPKETRGRLRSEIVSTITSKFVNTRNKEDESSFFDLFSTPTPQAQQQQPIVEPYDPSTGLTHKFSVVPLIDAIENIKIPYLQISSDSTQSVSWVPNMPMCLSTICNYRQLKVFDLRRDLNTPKVLITHSRPVSGLTFDPFHNDRLLTFSENVLNIWDFRKLNSPLLSINTGSSSITQASWCTTRSGVVATLAKDDQNVRFWEINESYQYDNNNDNNQTSTYLTQSPHVRWFHSDSTISSFSWHPTKNYQLLTISEGGMAELFELHDNIPFAWSPLSSITFSQGNTFKSINIEENKDISKLMMERAKIGYSLDIEDNYRLTISHSQLFHASINRLYEWMRTIHPISPRFQGIQSILRSDNSHSKGDTNNSYLTTSPAFPMIYQSPQRKLILQICGWGFDNNSSSFEESILLLEKKKAFKRAAAICVFHFNIERAIHSLHTGFLQTNDIKLQLVAMALSGFTEIKDEKYGLWKETCSAMINQLDGSYLKACFSFLCSEKDYQSILQDPELRLLDRIAFACRFLPDSLLTNYIDQVTKIVIKNGDLEGMAITGLSEDGVSLLQNYIDTTADIQTASLVMSHVVPSRFRDVRVQRWVYLYRQLLDGWELWSQRALFDLSFSDVDKKPSQVYAKCNFCNFSLSLNTQNKLKPTTYRNRSQPKEKLKVTGCPTCNKPLPRCSVCLLFLNCHLPDRTISVRDEDLKLQDGSKFAEWFTWCQSCKHGGHSDHIIEWFNNHSECPVADCHCNCSEL